MWDYITNVSNIILAPLGVLGTLLGSWFAYKQWRIIRHTEHVKFYSKSYRQVEKVKSLIERSKTVPVEAINEVKNACEYAQLHLSEDVVCYVRELKGDVLELWQSEKELADLNRKIGEMNEGEEKRRSRINEKIPDLRAKIRTKNRQTALYQKYTKLK